MRRSSFIRFVPLFFLWTSLSMAWEEPVKLSGEARKDMLIIAWHVSDHAKDLMLYSKATDVKSQKDIAGRICLRLFECWVLYNGGFKLDCKAPQDLENARKYFRSSTVKLKDAAPNWNDPRNLREISKTIPAGKTLENVLGRIDAITPGLDVSSIRNEADYDKMVKAFQDWLTKE